MNQKCRRQGSFLLVYSLTALAAWSLQLGCGGSGEDDVPEPRCDAPHLASASGLPLDEIAIEGIPAHFDTLLAAKVKADGATSTTLVARRDDGPIVLVAPIHPTGSAEGGEVTLEVVDAGGRSCTPIPFTILPLPPAPGATAAMFDQLRARHEGQARFFQTSIEALRRTDVDDLPAHLLPLYLAQHTLDDPENPNSLRALLDGSAPDLEGVAADIDLLDRLVDKLGLSAALGESLVELDALLAGAEAGTLALQAAPTAMGGSPRTAYALHAEMEMAQWARGYRGDSGLAQATRGTATAVGLGGLVPVPQVKAGSMVLGSGLFAFTKGAEAMAALLPSSFVSIDFQLSPSSFGEDDPSSGRWHDVEVVAVSEGWELDKALLESLLQLTKVKGGYDGWINRFAPKGFKASLNNHLRNQAVSKVIQGTAGGSGIVSIPPAETQPIDITEDPWSFAEVHFALVEDGRQGYRLDASWEGTYGAEIKVGTALGKFGGQHIYKNQKVPVLPLEIESNPRRASVDPGDVVEFTVTVRRAHDPSISAQAERGAVSLQRQPDGTHLLRYTAPASEDELPDSITIRSESTTGMLSNPARRRPSLVIPIRGTTPTIEITPRDICLDSGEKETFHAEVVNLDSQAVRWSASAGTITQQGVFTAPGIWGSVEISATSLEDESVKGIASIRIGNCSCHWTATLSGAVSDHLTGDSTILSLRGDGTISDLQFNGPEVDADGTADIIQVMVPQGVAPNATGSYPVLLHGLYVASGHTFAAEGIALHLDRFEPQQRTIDGEAVETYLLEGSISGTVEFAEIGGVSVDHDKPPPTGHFHLSFQGHYDYPILWMINCSGGYGDP